MPQDYNQLKSALETPRPTRITGLNLIEQLHPHTFSTRDAQYKWLRETGASLIFNGILYQGRTLDDVELTKTLLDNGQYRSQDAWLQKRADEYTLPDSELLFQLMRRLYQLREDAAYSDIVKRARKQFQDIFDEHLIITATAIDYEQYTTRALLRSRSPLSKNEQPHIEIPILAQYHHILDLEQPTHYSNEPNIPPKLHATLHACFGNDWQYAPNVLKYISSPRTTNEAVTKEIRFWTPGEQGRIDDSSRIFSLGANNTETFDIHANEYHEYCGWPALGVRIARE